MGQRCLILDATSVNQRVSSYGLMSLKLTKALEFFNALSVVLLEQRI
jgi:hypothetical protein